MNRLYAVQRGTWHTFPPAVEGMLISDRGELVDRLTAPNADELRRRLSPADPDQKKRLDKKFPGGYRVIWVRDVDGHPGIRAALRLLRAKDPKAMAPPPSSEVEGFVSEHP